MNSKKDVDLKQVCRICAVNVGDDTVSHLLIENNAITGLGEIFISCLGIQLMKDGYPDRVCDYCHLQLNTFHAFVRKAKSTSIQFANILKESIKEENVDTEANEAKEVTLTIADMEFEEGADQNIEDESTDKLSAPTEVEYIIEKPRDESGDISDVDEEYTIEYLEPEYMSTFEDEISQNETDSPEKEDDKTNKSTTDEKPKSRIRRSYPYKCKKCTKRFVYKEVYEAHIRMHKGLPGFSCPHCPKTFNEKANFDYHMQDHTNYRPAKCDMCDKSFKNKQDLASHIRCHKDIRKYMCDVCGKRFRSQSHMAYHRYAHFDERNFHCDQCDQKFKSPHILRTHKNTVHSNIFRYQSETCGRKFKRDHHLVTNHTKARRGKGPKKVQQTKVQVVELVKEEDAYDIDYVEENYDDSEFITAEDQEQ